MLSRYKRCGCRDDQGRMLGAACPKLRRAGGAWSPSHGTWYGKAELPPAPDGSRVSLRAGGFATQDEMQTWFAAAAQLIEVPEAGPDGHTARMEILALIKQAHRAQADLPPYDDIRRRYAEGVAFSPGTTGEYLLSWLGERRQAGDLAETTLLSYTAVVDRLFLPAFGQVPLDKLRTSHVLGMLDQVDAESARIAEARASDDPAVRATVAGRRPTSGATKRRILAVLRSALGDAVQARLLTANPAAVRTGRKTTTAKTRPRLWTPERERAWRDEYEHRAGGAPVMASFQAWRSTAARPSPVMLWTPQHLGQFLDAVTGDRLYPLFCLVAHTGLRRGEACGLRWAGTDLDSGWVSIETSVVQVGWQAVEKTGAKTAGSDAHVRIDQEVTGPAMRAWRRAQLAERVAWGPAWTDSGFVFTREDGTSWHPQQLTARFERLAFHAGLPPIRFHDLRHGAATLALAAGVDIAVVSRMMRHSSIRVTADVYADVLPELAEQTASKVVAMVPRRAAGGQPTRRPGS